MLEKHLQLFCKIYKPKITICRKLLKRHFYWARVFFVHKTLRTTCWPIRALFYLNFFTCTFKFLKTFSGTDRHWVELTSANIARLQLSKPFRTSTLDCLFRLSPSRPEHTLKAEKFALLFTFCPNTPAVPWNSVWRTVSVENSFFIQNFDFASSFELFLDLLLFSSRNYSTFSHSTLSL